MSVLKFFEDMDENEQKEILNGKLKTFNIHPETFAYFAKVCPMNSLSTFSFLKFDDINRTRIIAECENKGINKFLKLVEKVEGKGGKFSSMNVSDEHFEIYISY